MNLNLPTPELLPVQGLISWIVLGFAVSLGAVVLARYAYNSNRNYLGVISAFMLVGYFTATILGFNHLIELRQDKTANASAAVQQQVQTRYGLTLTADQARLLTLGGIAEVGQRGELTLYKTGGIYELVQADTKTELPTR